MLHHLDEIWQALVAGTDIVGGEESYGYLIGDKVRDKDAIASACMIAEAAAEEMIIKISNLRSLAPGQEAASN